MKDAGSKVRLVRDPHREDALKNKRLHARIEGKDEDWKEIVIQDVDRKKKLHRKI